MPDLTGLPALDVLIGMAFLFFLLATVVASINEVIQTVLNARARTLTHGIKTLLNDEAQANAFFEEWRIKRLSKPPGFVRSRAAAKLPLVAERRRPAYIPARAFALTLLETATRETPPKVGADLFAEAQATLDMIGPSSAQAVSAAGVAAARRRLDATRAEIERAYDEVMDRASGWYKRYVQWWVIFLGLAVAIGLNVNAFVVGERLWKDGALRAAVVQQAQKAVGDKKFQTPETATPKTVADQIDKIDQLKLPIGWGKANTEGNLLGRMAGWLATAAALALGAPFWFDLLGKLSRLRGTGNREGTAKDNERAPEDRDDPSRRRSAVA
jgi:small basic protein